MHGRGWAGACMAGKLLACRIWFVYLSAHSPPGRTTLRVPEPALEANDR